MKTVLIFQFGQVIKQLSYKTQRDAIRHYKGFLKRGYLDPNTGLPITNATFELI